MREIIARFDEENKSAFVYGEEVGEIIRCKDCKYWQCDDSESYCDELGIFNTDMNSYCSYARRKEE